MRELPADQYPKAQALVRAVPFNNLFARVVLEGKVWGRVLVDDEVHPSVCLVVHKYGMALLCGSNANSSFNRSLRGFLQNDALNDGSAKWLICHPGEWEGTLTTLLGRELAGEPSSREEPSATERRSRSILKTERVNFKFDGRLPNRREIPAGFTLRRVDSNLCDRIQGTVIPEYFWNSAQVFLSDGIGFSLLTEGQVVSTAFSSFIVEDKLELGVETDPRYRGRGLASFPAIELLDYCVSHGYEPVWACRRGNIPSFRLALKLGFSPATFHPYYILPAGKGGVRS